MFSFFRPAFQGSVQLARRESDKEVATRPVNSSVNRLPSLSSRATLKRTGHQNLMNVFDFLLSGKQPVRTALQTLEGDHTYGELQNASLAVADYLLESGAAKGDRILLVAENSFFWASAYLGILRAGLVCIPLAPSITSQSFTFIVQSTAPRGAFLQSAFYLKNSAEFSGCTVVTEKGAPEIVGRKAPARFDEILSAARLSEGALPPVGQNDLAALMYTSGSTATPRGVMITHGNIIANTRSIIEYLHLTEKDRMMTVLPFHYCFGTSLLHTHLAVGGCLVLDHRFMYPEAVLERMQVSQCTGFAGVPSHYQILLRRSGLHRMRFPSLRYVQQAGGHLAPAFVRELRKVLPQTEIFIMYGQTEATARLAYLPPDMLEKKAGSIGKAIPGVILRVLDESGREVSPGETGEVVAEGENVALGYWDESEETANCFRNGRLYTGDLATVDEDGFIYVVDRAKDFVKCGGKRVSCRQVEEQLLDFEDLLEVAVIGVPDDVAGEALKAFVVPRDRRNISFDEQLRLFCRDHLPYQLIPKEFVKVESLPKNSAGKILKQTLKSA